MYLKPFSPINRIAVGNRYVTNDTVKHIYWMISLRMNTTCALSNDIFFLNGCHSTKHVYWNSRQGSLLWKMLHTIHEEKSTLSPLLMIIARFIRWRRIKGGFNISKPSSTHPKAISKKKRTVAGIKYINIYTSLKLWEGDKYLYTTDIWSTVCRRHFRLHFVKRNL